MSLRQGAVAVEASDRYQRQSVGDHETARGEYPLTQVAVFRQRTRHPLYLPGGWYV